MFILKLLFERYQQEMPEEYCKPANCKEGKTYDRNDETCKKCYAANRLQSKMFERIVSKMSTKQLEDLLTSALNVSNDNDNDPKRNELRRFNYEVHKQVQVA